VNEIKWEDPPPDGRSTQWSEVTDQLRARPGSWAIVAVRRSIGSASDICEKFKTARQSPAFAPAGSFEAVTRKVDGEYRVYARYLGGES
jgi:hypothetical protein